MIERFYFPWDREGFPSNSVFEPTHYLLSEYTRGTHSGEEFSTLMVENQSQSKLVLHPYPRTPRAIKPDRVGFLEIPHLGKEPSSESEKYAKDAFLRMNEIQSRIEDLKLALENPSEVWSRLRRFWKKSLDAADPGMSEIIRQAEIIPIQLHELNGHLRRILRRTHERVPISRVMEMDRPSIRWLARQPGRNVLERAGTDQSVMAIVRNESFDTLENRVLHSYSELATNVAREWIQEHKLAVDSKRYRKVRDFQILCRRMANELSSLGIGLSDVGVTPNYVLLENPRYRTVYQAWRRLLLRKKISDNLWSWQAETWTDFICLAIILVFDELEESELIFQSPINFLDEPSQGRLYFQDHPQSVFWLKKSELIIEIQSRNKYPDKELYQTRSQIIINITDLSKKKSLKKIVVWTPHTQKRINLRIATENSCSRLRALNQSGNFKTYSNGLLLVPAHGDFGTKFCVSDDIQVHAIAFDGAGESLIKGMDILNNIVKNCILET